MTTSPSKPKSKGQRAAERFMIGLFGSLGTMGLGWLLYWIGLVDRPIDGAFAILLWMWWASEWKRDHS